MTGRHRKAYRDLKKLDKPTLHMLRADATNELVDPDTSSKEAERLVQLIDRIEEILQS